MFSACQILCELALSEVCLQTFFKLDKGATTHDCALPFSLVPNSAQNVSGKNFLSNKGNVCVTSYCK